MKNLRIAIFVLALMIWGSNQSMAQLVKFGVKAGANFPSLNDTNGNFSFDASTGYHFGAAVLVNVPIVKVGAELLYSQTGFTVPNIPDDFKVATLDLPIYAKISILKILSIHAGPSFSIVTSASMGSQDIADQWKENTFHLVAGAGVTLGALDIHGRFIFPSKIDATIPVLTTEINNSTIQLSATYYINHK